MWLIREMSVPELLRHATRTALTVLGIALGVASIVAMSTATDAVFRAFRRTIEATAGSAELQLSNGGAGVAEELVERTRRVPGVVGAVPLVQGFVQLKDAGRDSLAIFGFDVLGDSEHESQLPRTALEIPDELLFLNHLDSIALAKPFARARGYDIGSELDVLTPAGPQRLVVRGLVDGRGPASLFAGVVGLMDLPAAQRLLDRRGVVDRIDVTLEAGASRADVMQRLAGVAAGLATVGETEAHGGRAEDLLYAVRVMLALSALISAVVGFFMIYHTVAVSIARRRRAIAVLSAVGVSRAAILGWLLMEAVLLGTAAAVVGIPAGFLLARAAVDPLGAVATAWVHVRPESVTLAPTAVVAALGVAFVTTLTATLVPAWTIVSQPVVRSLTGQRSEPHRAGMGRATLGALLGLAITAVLVATSPRTLPFAPMVAYAAIVTCLPLASLALLSPVVAVAIGRLAQSVSTRSRGLSVLLASSTLTRNPTRPAAVVAAVVTGVAFTLVDASVVRSFERSFLGWLDEYYQSDLVVGAGTTTVALLNSPAVTEDVAREIAGIPGVREAQGVRVVEVPFRGLPAVLQALDRTSRPLPLVDGDWEAIAPALWAGRGVVVSHNLAIKQGIRRNERLVLRTAEGRREFSVLGIFTDYGGGDFGSVTMDRTLYRALWRDRLVNRIRVWLDPGADPLAVRAAIEARYAETHGLRVLTAGEFRAAARDLYVNNVLKILYALLVIALTISFLGVVNFLLTSIIDRQSEVRVLRAIGVPGWRIAGAIVTEGALVGLVGAVTGIAAGAIASRIIVTNAVVITSGWRFHYEFPLGMALVLAVVTIGVAGAAGLVPARVALRRQRFVEEPAE